MVRLDKKILTKDRSVRMCSVMQVLFFALHMCLSDVMAVQEGNYHWSCLFDYSL